MTSFIPKTNVLSRLVICLTIAAAAGCGTKNYNVADPVVGPAPPRIKDALALQEAAEQNKEKTTAQLNVDAGVKPVKFEEKAPLPPTAVVANVNGRPVLVGEVLEQYSAKLKEYDTQLAMGVAKGVLSEEQRQTQMRKTQEMLIKRDLYRFIEQILMADAVRSKLKKEQLEGVTGQMDKYFEKDVVGNLKKKLKVDSTAELEFKLQEQGMSLETMRKMFADQQLASQYLRTKMGEDPRPSRAEIVAVYNSQLEKYERPLQVKWQQLQINISGPQGRTEALARLAQAQADLRSGKSFDDVVKQHSEGPLKENGGHWDWTQPQSVANPEVRKALEKLRAGEISEPLESGNSLNIVKVVERREFGHQPLEEVQEDIRQQIISEFRERRSKEVIAEVHERAVVETIFDEDFNSENESRTQ